MIASTSVPRAATRTNVRRSYLVLAVLPILAACAHATEDGVGGSSSAGGAPATSGSSSSKSGSTVSTTASTTTSSTDASSSSDAATSSASASTTAASTVASSSASSSSSTGSGTVGAVYFSEYIEGSSNNKAVEIFNGSSTALDLGDCQIDRFQNGATTALAPIALTATMLPAAQTFVVCHTSFSQPGLCDQLTGSLQHNGNDAVELVCGGVVKDVIGKVGEDVIWGTAPTSTADATLRRKCSVTVGDTNPNDAFDPATQWDGDPIDTFTDLGQYLCP